MPSVNTKRRFLVTLKSPELKIDFGRSRSDSTMSWDFKAPTREFEGEIRYYVSEWGHLSIQNTDFEARVICLFANGQWVSIEELSVNTKQPRKPYESPAVEQTIDMKGKSNAES